MEPRLRLAQEPAPPHKLECTCSPGLCDSAIRFGLANQCRLEGKDVLRAHRRRVDCPPNYLRKGPHPPPLPRRLYVCTGRLREMPCEGRAATGLARPLDRSIPPRSLRITGVRRVHLSLTLGSVVGPPIVESCLGTSLILQPWLLCLEWRLAALTLLIQSAEAWPIGRVEVKTSLIKSLQTLALPKATLCRLQTIACRPGVPKPTRPPTSCGILAETDDATPIPKAPLPTGREPLPTNWPRSAPGTADAAERPLTTSRGP